jgi:cysteine desulfurase
MAYLDYAATAPLRTCARQALIDALDHYGNPSSVHQIGQEARFLLDTARRQVANFVNVRPEQVVFTSSGTEANNLALRGVMAEHSGKRLLTTTIEHHCVLNTSKTLEEESVEVSFLKLNEVGQICLEELEKELKKGGVALVSVQHANNETGVINDIPVISQLCHEHGALIHTDAVQTAGHLPLDFVELGVDLLTMASHKMGGPKGAAALIMRGKIDMQATTTGGAQERKRRAGTENVPALVGFGAALEEIAQSFDAENEQIAKLQEILEKSLEKIGLPVEIVAKSANRVPHITQIVCPGMNAENALIAFDLEGFAISQGAACSSGRTEPSHVLLALGFSEEDAACGLRISYGFNTTEAEIENFVEAFEKIYSRFLKS